MSSICALFLMIVSATDDRPGVIVVVGAAGTPEYGEQFHRWSGLWRVAAAKGSAAFQVIGLDSEAGVTDHDRLHSALAEHSTPGREPLWLVLIGHGTFDAREAKFNLRGPDLTDVELVEWLKPLKRPLAVIDCTSASGPFLNKLSGENRVVVTATRSGDEQNFARFGQYLAESIADPAADRDKDGQVSLLEAYLTASARVAEYYKTKSQLATEHPLIDDNGDRLGTPPDWFQGVRVTRRPKDGTTADGTRAHQFHLIPSNRERGIPVEAKRRRDEIEQRLAALRDQKSKLPEDDYYTKLESLMVELATIYRDAEKTAPALPSKPR